jgi:hypothetical protein
VNQKENAKKKCEPKRDEIIELFPILVEKEH